MKTVIAILITLCILACTGEDSRQMHEALMQAKAQNENFEPFTTDSTMLRVVDYYDSTAVPTSRCSPTTSSVASIATLAMPLMPLSATMMP
jgi:hypothetical protein